MTTTIPDYLTPAFQQLDAARADHLEHARQMDDTTTAIARTAEQKVELEKENGNEASGWRAAFRAGGAMLTDELKQQHLARVASRELAQECDRLAEVLAYDKDRLKASCDISARKYRQAHHNVLSEYAGKELDNALRQTCGALVRAMKLKMLALGNPLANTVGIQGYVEPDKAVMQEVQTWLERAVRDCHIRLADEPVLFKAGLSAETLAHMNYGVAVTHGQRQTYFNKLRERETDLKARGLLE
ncbi:glycoprotein 3 [Escherichia coli]|uniref:glycoprotein 3 n=1 Tax=Escherichia coli TaxID=562 RepID=UPI0018E13FC2|nr:glycoprotein 3 [Escherichia coli]MBI1042600.1 glycoprotein 3 [Escherichia coli]MCO7785517.1 glycoprotein 3 [Escherichia coli]MCO7804400.1 glycoprotein 3 [Escherichia coli]HAW5731608.1 glycoprotein 3 [Escherichia coli]HCL7250838.1 glycoprotein 3 [Escherichia coli]